MLGPTREMASFARRFELELVREPARRVARASILDTFACALGALDERVTRAVQDYVQAEGSAGSATIWGTAVRASPARAALANATAAHALDFDDVSWAMHGHPSAPLLGAVMAMAEARRASGAEMLAAYIAGFEAQARLGQALTRSHYARGWHPTSTLGAIGAAVAAGRLLGLGERELRCALGIACSEAAGSRMNFGTQAKPTGRPRCGIAIRRRLDSVGQCRDKTASNAARRAGTGTCVASFADSGERLGVGLRGALGDRTRSAGAR